MKLLVMFIIGILSFKGCNNDSYKIYAVLEDANGLSEGSKVKCKGLEVGVISGLKIVGNSVIATLDLKHDFQATKGTVAQVNSIPFLGNAQLNLIPTDNTALLANGDTIYAIAANPLSVFDELIKTSDLDSLKNKINLKNINLDSLSGKLDSLGMDELLKKAEKIMDLNKILP